MRESVSENFQASKLLFFQILILILDFYNVWNLSKYCLFVVVEANTRHMPVWGPSRIAWGPVGGTWGPVRSRGAHRVP